MSACTQHVNNEGLTFTGVWLFLSTGRSAVGAGRKTGSDASPQYTVGLPAAECAKLVRYCSGIEVAVPAEVVAAAGDCPAPPSPAKSKGSAAGAVSASVVSTAATVHADEGNTSAPAASGAVNSTTASGTAAPASVALRKMPVDAVRANRDRTNAKSAVTSSGAGGKTTSDSREGRKRGGAEAASKASLATTANTVDTRSAIEQLEKSCLQKPSIGGAATTAKGNMSVVPQTVSDGAKPASRAAVPVQSAWKVPTAPAAAAGQSESKTSETTQSLRDIQVSDTASDTAASASDA
jgi:hypothetical protein